MNNVFDRRMKVAALLLLGFWVLIWNGDALFGSSTWYFHDLKHHHYPWRAWAGSAWANNELPLWAPIAHGYPLMADGQAGVLYPVNIVLYYLLPTHFAFNLSVIIHHIAAAWGGFALARVMGRTSRGALIAGIIYGFSGLLITHLVYLGMFQVIALTPWMLVAAVKGVKEGWVWWIVAGLVTGMAWLAGHPQMALYATYAMVFMSLWTGWAASGERSKNMGRVAVGIAIVGLVSLTIASPQLYASYELASFGHREGGVDNTFAALGGLPFEEMLNGFFPSPFGYERAADIPITYHHRADIYQGRGVSYLEGCFYLGVLTAVLLFVAGFKKNTRGWWVLAGVGMLMMFGVSTPFYSFIRLLPGMEWFRFPVRASLWVVLAASQLAAIGRDRLDESLVTEPHRMRRWARFGLLALALTTVMAGVANIGFNSVRPDLEVRLTESLTRPAPDPALVAQLTEAGAPLPVARTAKDAAIKAHRLLDEVESNITPWRPRLLGPLMLLFLFLMSIRLASSHRMHLTTPGRIVTIMLAIDLFIFGVNFNPRTDVEVVTKRPDSAVVILGEEGVFRTTVFDRRVPTELDTDLLSSNMGLIFGLEDVIIPSPLRTVRNEAYTAATGLDLTIVNEEQQIEKFRENRHLSDLSGVRYLFSTTNLDFPDFEVAHQEELTLNDNSRQTLRVYRNKRALDRAFTVGCTDVVPDGDPALAAVIANHHPDQRAIVSDGLGLPTCEPGPVGEVKVRRGSPSSLTIEAKLDKPGWLVITESRYPGQVLTVDGEVREAVTTNYLFQGIALDAGDHTIEFDYRPTPILAAMGTSAASFVALLSLLFFKLNRRAEETTA